MAPSIDLSAPVLGDLSPQALVEEHYKAAPDLPLGKLGTGLASPGIRVEPLTIIDDPAEWTAKDYPDLEQHIFRLSADDIAELDAAVRDATLASKKIADVTKKDFQLPNLGPKLEAARDEVRFGRGWYLIRGVPVERYSQRESALAYWGFGLYWGRVVSQNAKGHILGHVKDIRMDPRRPDTRVYGTSLAQPWHTDASDIVGLLCLKTAKAGGESSWSSSVAVHNELLRLGRADLLEALSGPWWVDRKGEIPDGKKPYFRLPIMNYYKGYLSTSYNATYYELAQRHPEVPRLTDKQREAVRYFNAIAKSDALRLDFILQPGDIQLLHNHQMLHTRTKFEDYPELHRRRHLYRLWVSPPANDRPLPPDFAELFDSTEPGNRGGITVPGQKLCTPLDGE